ncbi:MAG: sulfite exporter TauE/SafE family protein [Desulfovibrionales bacterium]|nr:sulfite exporter TauE/SafE family protein [Desulfovibrionales bacterium]
MRKLFQMLVTASALHARWEYETSMTILRSKKRLMILGLMLIPAVLVTVALASDTLPDVLGGKKAYTPAFYTLETLLISIVIGLCAGLITGAIGAGGGFIITPALMSAGIKGILAVGTDLFHIFAKAIMGTAVHKKLGNVSVKLAIAFLVGSSIGVTCGGVINRTLYELNPLLSDTFISLIYVFLLGFLGIYSMLDFLSLRKKQKNTTVQVGGEEGTTISSKLQSVNIPPMISFDENLIDGGKKISGWFVAFCGAIVGFVAAIMGVGGGFLTFPMFVYVLGVSSFTTVGTDILQIIFTAGYAAITQYAVYGFIFYTLAMGMLIGSLIGIQLGALTTSVVDGLYIRGFYAAAILAGFANRLFALPAKLNDMQWISIPQELASFLTSCGNYAFFIVVAFFALWVLSKFVTNLHLLKEA